MTIGGRIANIVNALFGGTESSCHDNVSESQDRKEWREQIHASRNEATKAISSARESERSSNKSTKQLREDMPRDLRELQLSVLRGIRGSNHDN